MSSEAIIRGYVQHRKSDKIFVGEFWSGEFTKISEPVPQKNAVLCHPLTQALAMHRKMVYSESPEFLEEMLPYTLENHICWCSICEP